LAIEFITMPVPLADLKCSVNLVRQGIRLDPASPRSQPHSSTQLLYAAQFAQLIDHAVRCRWIKLARVRLLQSNHIPGELDASRLHSQTNAEIWNLVLPRIANCAQHPFNPALPESPRDQNSVIILKLRLVALIASLQPFGFNPIQLQFEIVRQSTVHQCL